MKRKKNRKGGNQIRDANPSRASVFLLRDWDCLPDGVTPLSKCPEVLMAVCRVADLVSSMPLHVMENTKTGNQRVHDGLARKLDIDPNPYMSRKTLCPSSSGRSCLKAPVTPSRKSGSATATTHSG